MKKSEPAVQPSGTTEAFKPDNNDKCDKGKSSPAAAKPMHSSLKEGLQALIEAPIREVAENLEAKVFDPMKSQPLWELDKDVLNPFEEIPPLQAWIKMADRPAIPKQGIVTFSAKPKKGKSLSIYALMIPLLTGRKFDNVEPLDTPRLVMVFDTEMDKPTLNERVKALHRQLGSNNVRFVVVPLLEAKKSDRTKVIEEKIAAYSPDIIAIDQVARLVDDFNSSTENVAFGEWLARIAAHRTTLTVIHQNSGLDDNKMKGHLGSITGELAVENYAVSYDNGVFSITPVNSRRSRIDEKAAPFRFALQDDGTIITASDILASRQEEERDKWRSNFAALLGDDEALTYTSLRARIIEREGISQAAASRKIEEARKCGAIRKVEEREKSSPYRLV